LFGPGQNILVLHSMNTGVEQELEVDLARVNGPRWSSDGRSLFVYGPDRKELNGLRLLDVETGSVSGPYLTRAGDVPPVTALAWGPDGRHAYLKRDRQRISGIDVGTGEEKVLYQAPADSVLGTLAVSPDGGSIAFDVYLRAEHRFRLFVIPTGGGTPRELLDASGPDRVNPEGWTHDGRQLLFVRTSSNAPERKHVGELWAVASEGGPARRLGLSMPALRDVSVSPAGDRIAFTSGYPDTGIWVFENFLPRTVSR
jgi:Tol biopolymer transport system component